MFWEVAEVNKNMDNGVCPMSSDDIAIVKNRLSQKEYITQKLKQQLQKGIEDPLIIADIDEIVERYKRWCRLFPRVKPFYAIKCNNASLVLTVLAGLGCSFDCASKAEIQQVLDMGVKPSRIVYANTCKQPSYLTYAEEHDVDLMTFDNEGELIKIRKLYPSARLLLRFRPDHNYKVGWDLGKKYGCGLDEVRRLLESAKKNGLDVVGVSFHVGSNCRDARAYKIAIEHSRMIFDIGHEVGFNMTILDIGGGYTGRDVDSPTIEEESDVINKSLDKNFPETEGVEIIAEPGRFFIESAYTAGACVIGRNIIYATSANKHREDTSDINSVMYTINDGMYGTFNWVFARTETFEASPIEEKIQHREYPSVIWGPTCDNHDYLTMDLSLPLLDVGDWIYISYAGAYSLPMITTFNSMPRAALTYFCSSDVWASLKDIHRSK